MTTRQCIECGAVKPLEEMDGHTCKACWVEVRRTERHCQSDGVDTPRTKCLECNRWYMSWWGQFDCPHCAGRLAQIGRQISQGLTITAEMADREAGYRDENF